MHYCISWEISYQARLLSSQLHFQHWTPSRCLLNFLVKVVQDLRINYPFETTLSWCFDFNDYFCSFILLETQDLATPLLFALFTAISFQFAFFLLPLRVLFAQTFVLLVCLRSLANQLAYSIFISFTALFGLSFLLLIVFIVFSYFLMFVLLLSFQLLSFLSSYFFINFLSPSSLLSFIHFASYCQNFINLVLHLVITHDYFDSHFLILPSYRSHKQ